MTQCFFYSASEFIRKLDKLHRDINQTTALIQEPSPENMINMPRLRAAMDLCIEQLPTLLKIEQDGAVSVTQLLPRVLSQLRALSVYSESGSSVGAEERISESMGYVLQKVHILMMVIGLSGVVPMPSVIIRVTGSPICLITNIITDRIVRHEILLPVDHKYNKTCNIL